MTFSEILETIAVYLNDSALMANISLVLIFIVNAIKTIKGTHNQPTNVVVKGNEEELKSLNNQIETLKKMFVVAFNNSKLDTSTKLKLSELSENSNKLIEDGNGLIENISKIDVKEDIVNPIKKQIIEKVENVANAKNTDLLKNLTDTLNNL